MAERGRWWRKSFSHLYPLIRNRHQVEVNLDALRRIGVYPGVNERRAHFVPGADAEQKIEALALPPPFVDMHPASHWTFRCCPAERNALLPDLVADATPPVGRSGHAPAPPCYDDML